MKKIVIIVCAIVWLMLTANAKTVYFKHSNGEIEACNESSIDSVKFSKTDINGNLTKNFITQIIYRNDGSVSYVPLSDGNVITYNAPQGIIPSTDITKLNIWQFSSDNKSFSPVALPHTCNSTDAVSRRMFKGTTYYKYILNAKATEKYTLYISKAGQVATVLLNGKEMIKHYGAYTGFFVKLDELIDGDNEICINCNNEVDLANIPISADFNFYNGLFGEVLLIKSGEMYFSSKFGADRYHISQTDISKENARFEFETAVGNASGNDMNVYVRVSLMAQGTKIITKDIPIKVENNSELSISENFELQDPHLWNGVKDPFLYDVVVELVANNQVIDRLSGKVGFRWFEATADNGFKLNGESYPLRGVAIHQDGGETAAAMTHAQFDTDYENIMEIGANMVRLAHYPHDRYVFDKCDELGIVVQTEIPWVNESGINAPQEYFDHITINMEEMINNYYNKSCVIFWGMSNELGGTHAAYPQGAFDVDTARKFQDTLYDKAKIWDPYRLIGYVSDKTDNLDWKADWIAVNVYRGWYSGKFSNFSTTIDNDCPQNIPLSVAEYGAGANPATHSDDPMTTTNKGTGGARHDEEFQNLFHESYLQQINAHTKLNFTSLWAMNDFAVSGRNEGGTPYINDKGLITRDREVKKDAFYLYKAAWNPEPVVYISSRRFTERETEDIKIKVYSNCDELRIYRDNRLMQTLYKEAATDGIIWNFNPIYFSENAQTIKVDAYCNGELKATDHIEFSTTATLYPNEIIVNTESLSLYPDVLVNVEIRAINEYVVSQEGDFYTIERNDNGIVIYTKASAKVGETGKIIIYNAEKSVEIPISICSVILLDHITNKSSNSCDIMVETDINPTMDITTEFKIAAPNTSSSDFFGVYNNPNDAECFFVLASSKECQLHAGSKAVKIACDMTIPHTFMFNAAVATIDGVKVGDMKCSVIETDKTITLFRFNTDSQNRTNRFKLGEFYYLKFWKGATLVAEYIPCLDKNGKVAIYDTVTQKILPNLLDGKNITYTER